MSREIKFRVKEILNDTPQAEWSYFTIGDLACSNFSTKHNHFVGETWTQFTGLLDKNGKEIYEGDIVNVPYVDPMGQLCEDTVDHTARVVFDFGRFALQEYPTNKPLTNGCRRHEGEYVSNFGNPTILHEETIYEIIGNIYENEELLK